MDDNRLEKRNITDEMKESYLDYAMSVIVSRALPDVRDGLKPVHRRILFAMHEAGLRHNAKYSKCAGVVGDVLKKFHPHGDMAVYDALVRLAQPWSLRYPLIDGQGNFGSIDGDSAAAYRYTEARMMKLAEELLEDIEKDTVDFQNNYDATRREPMVLPARVPQLLMNGTVGIAVGMATNILPHNLTELINGMVYLIDHPKATSEDLTEFVLGPDFPTGGIIYNEKDIKLAYATGKGAIVSRAKAEIQEGQKRGTSQIIVTEIPYQVNKAELLLHIAELVKEKKIEGIRDLRDESDKDGLRIAIDLKADSAPQKVLNKLYQLTDLQKTFHLNMLALVDGLQPQVLSLKSILQYFLDHRNQVVTRRTKFDLTKAQERAHILEGLNLALDHIDAVIKTIKQSESREDAHKKLRVKFELTDIQANAILEMRLATLAALERQKIETELKEMRAKIKELKLILATPARVWDVIKKEFAEIKNQYQDERKTKIFKSAVREFSEEELVAKEETIITLSFSGYIKRMSPSSYKVQKRGGRGMIGVEVKEEDQVQRLLVASTHDEILFFSSSGKVLSARAFEIPEGTRVSRGKLIHNFLNLPQNETISAQLALPKETRKENKADQYLVLATAGGKIKKVALNEFRNIRRSGMIAIKLQKGDELRWVKSIGKGDDIILVTKNGQSIRFAEKDARSMGRNAAGTRGIRLKKSDEVIGMDVVKGGLNQGEILMVMDQGYGKRTSLKEYKRQHRGGSGVHGAKVNDKTGLLVAAEVLNQAFDHHAIDLIAISKKGQVIRTPLPQVTLQGRDTQGVRIMKLHPGDKVVSITLV